MKRARLGGRLCVAASLLAVAVSSLHCGSRSGTLDQGTPGGGAAPDAGVTPDPCAPPELNVSCAATIASAPAGSEVWTTTLDVSPNELIGPAAADDAGTTYFVAAESGLYVKEVLALDACGALRWRVSVASLLLGSAYIPQIMVSGSRLLLVGVGSITALDRATGAHAWTADLTAFVQGGGLGVPPGKVQALGYTAARKDGTAFTVVANGLDVWIVAVSPAGGMKPVSVIANYLTSFMYPLGAQQFAIDAVGNLVLAGGTGPGPGQPLRAFTAAGKPAFATWLPSWGTGRALAAGPDTVTGDGAWLIDRKGQLRNENPGGGPNFVSWRGPTAIDAAGSLFVVGSQNPEGSPMTRFNMLGNVSAEGQPRWSIALDEDVTAGPILGDGGQLFAVTHEGFDPGSSQHLVAHAQSDGAELWKVPLPPSGKRPTYWLLLNDAGALVLRIDDRVFAFASGLAKPPRCAWWPTPRGGADQRVCAWGA